MAGRYDRLVPGSDRRVTGADGRCYRIGSKPTNQSEPRAGFDNV